MGQEDIIRYHIAKVSLSISASRSRSVAFDLGGMNGIGPQDVLQYSQIYSFLADRVCCLNSRLSDIKLTLQPIYCFWAHLSGKCRLEPRQDGRIFVSTICSVHSHLGQLLS